MKDLLLSHSYYNDTGSVPAVAIFKGLGSCNCPNNSGGWVARFLPAILLSAALLLSGCVFFTPDGTVTYVEYEVQKGDSLPDIARHFDATPEQILALNKLDGPQDVTVGRVLRIPYRDKSVQRVSATVPVDLHHTIKRDNSSVNMIKLNPGARKYVGHLLWPVHAAQLTSVFGRRWSNFHEGLDLMAEEGSPIFAAHSGTVVYSGDGLSGYGELIVIKGDGLLTVYGHNRRNLVRRGDSVSRGDYIGDVGATGHATGPHVHFETRVATDKGTWAAVDPLAFFPVR